MVLDSLISEYFLLETALTRSMAVDGSTRDRVRFLRGCADMLEKIEQYTPTDSREAKDKVFFFLNRAITRPGLTVDGRDLNIALALCDSSSYHPPPVAERNGAGLQPRAPILRDPDLTLGIIGYVRRSRERVSLIDADYRYIATSRPNADFYGTRPARMIGVHLADMIGQSRFLARAKQHIDACANGEPQEYYHSGSDREGTDRVYRCQMKPVELPDASGGCAVMIYMHDVTETIPTRIEPLPA